VEIAITVIIQYNKIQKIVTCTMLVGRIGRSSNRWWQMGNKR